MVIFLGIILFSANDKRIMAVRNCFNFCVFLFIVAFMDGLQSLKIQSLLYFLIKGMCTVENVVLVGNTHVRDALQIRFICQVL